LLPLAEIAHDFIHPVFKINISDLLEKCEDSGKVALYE
jgi:7,8-dihydro-6-hydroxymethylpterin-pyrophosphokinase